MKKAHIEMLTYVLAILLVNIVFFYVRSFFDNKTLVTILHIVLGTLQLIALVPKIIERSKGR